MRIHHHLGLGDHLVCYGLVRTIAESEPVELYCKWHNMGSVSQMYKGTGVKLIGVKSDDECSNAVKIGFTKECETEENFGEEFYRQAGVPYSYRWKYPIHREREREVTEYENIFIHNDVFPRRTYSIFDWWDAIENAEEVHCIESCFRLAIDFMEPKGKLVLHFDKEKSWRVVPTKHKWEIYEKEIS